MLISLGEIIIISTVALVILKPHDIVSIMNKLGNIAKAISNKYSAIVAEVKNWWEKR